MSLNTASTGEDKESSKTLVPHPEKLKVTGSLPKVASQKLLAVVKYKKGSALRQICAALSANLGPINTGMSFGFSAVALPQLQAAGSELFVSEEQASWIASLTSMTTPVGCILSGYFMDTIGRKKILILTQVPLIIGWLLIAMATNVPMIYAGRLLVGLGSGMVGAPSRVYVSETSQAHLRGSLAALASVGVSLGVTIEYTLGTAFSWKILALLSSTIPIVGFLAMFFIPESPAWLASVGKHDDCRDSLRKLRGKTCDVDHEANILKDFSEKNNMKKLTFKESLLAMARPATLKPFVILSLYFLIYQFSGVNPVTFYAVTIFQESGAQIDAYFATVMIGILRLFFTIVSCILMRRCGRRPLTFVSSVLCGLTMLGLGSYMSFLPGWKELGEDPKMSWIPVMCISIFMAASTIGYLVVPWVMIGEVYPSQVRGVAGGLTTCVAHFSIFMVVKSFPFFKHVSTYGTFLMYGCISLLGTIFFYLVLPETKGRTLQEIEDYFKGRISTLKKPKPEKLTNNNRSPIVIKVDIDNSTPPK